VATSLEALRGGHLDVGPNWKSPNVVTEIAIDNDMIFALTPQSKDTDFYVIVYLSCQVVTSELGTMPF
jgi:hypothetical protein